MNERQSPRRNSSKRPYDTEGMDPEMQETLKGETARRDTIASVTKPYRPPWGWSWFERKPKKVKPKPKPKPKPKG